MKTTSIRSVIQAGTLLVATAVIVGIKHYQPTPPDQLALTEERMIVSALNSQVDDTSPSGVAETQAPRAIPVIRSPEESRVVISNSSSFIDILPDELKDPAKVALIERYESAVNKVNALFAELIPPHPSIDDIIAQGNDAAEVDHDTLDKAAAKRQREIGEWAARRTVHQGDLAQAKKASLLAKQELREGLGETDFALYELVPLARDIRALFSHEVDIDIGKVPDVAMYAAYHLKSLDFERAEPAILERAHIPRFQDSTRSILADLWKK